MNSDSVRPEPREPAPWQRLGVAFLAVVFLLWPFLWAPAARPGASQGAELVRDGRALLLSHPELTQLARGEGSLGALLTSDWWGGSRPAEVHYRPLASALLGLSTLVAGKPYDPQRPGAGALPFKLFSLALHAICVLLVIELAWRLMGKAPHALAGGLLFAALPVHANVILDAGALALQLGTALSLAALCAWYGSASASGPGTKGALAAGCLALLGALAHEVAFALPLLLLAFELARSRQGGFGEALRGALGRAPALLPVVVGLGAAALARHGMVGSLWPAADLIDPTANPLVEGGPLARILNGLRMAAAGLGAAVGFDPLASRFFGGSPDHSASQVAALAAFAPANLLGLGVLGGVLALSVALFARCRTRGALAVALVLSLVLLSNAVVTLPEAFAAELLLLPGAVLALFLAPFFGRRGTAGLAVALAAAVAGGVWLHAESRHWQSQTSLWRHVANHTAKESGRAHTELGAAFLSELLYSMGQNSLVRATQLAPKSAAAFALLGDAKAANFDPSGASADFRRAVELVAEQSGWRYDPRREQLAPRTSLLLYRISQLESTEGATSREDHLSWLESLSERGWDSPYVDLYRSRALLELGQVEAAEAALRNSIAKAPTVENVRSLGRLLLNTNRGEEAIALYREHGPRFEGADSAEAELRLHQAGAELVRAPAAALEIVENILASPAPLSQEQRFQAHFVAAQALLELGENELERARNKAAAVDHLTNGLLGYQEVNDDTAFALHSLGQLLFAQGAHDRARTVLESMLARREGPTQRWMLGVCLARLGEPAAAVKQLELSREGLTRSGPPVSPEIYLAASIERLRALFGLANSGEGQSAYEAAIAERNHPEDREAIARHLAASGRASEALVIARELANSERPALRDSLPAFERAVELDRDGERMPDNPALLAERSSLRLFLGDAIAAITDAQRALQFTAEGPDRGVRLTFLAQAQAGAGLLVSALGTWREAAAYRDTPAQEMARIEEQIALLEAALGNLAP